VRGIWPAAGQADRQQRPAADAVLALIVDAVE
jgi:hypothetical protein